MSLALMALPNAEHRQLEVLLELEHELILRLDSFL
jgi:hypothetical protein